MGDGMVKTIYFKDVDTDRIVRKRENEFALEYIFPNADGWVMTEQDHSYEREYYLGEGNTCLFDVSEEEAYNTVKQWGLEDLFYKIPEENNGGAL